MIRFNDAPNIIVVGTLISYTIKPSGPPDSSEMSVDGYETDIVILLSKLRWSFAGWALINDIYRKKDKTMLIIPWNELPYLDSANHEWKGFNATAGAKVLPKLVDGPVDMGKVQAAADAHAKNSTLVRYNPGMWTDKQVAAVGFIASPAAFKAAPGVQTDEILLHEMVHGLRQMRGTTDFHKPKDLPHYDTVEEFMAIVVSNVYRSEQKRPGLRRDHWGFDPLPAEQENPQKFLDSPGVGGESNRSRMLQFQRENPDFCNDLKRSPAAFNPFKLI